LNSNKKKLEALAKVNTKGNGRQNGSVQEVAVGAMDEAVIETVDEAAIEAVDAAVVMLQHDMSICKK
jgi:hypothetical protein